MRFLVIGMLTLLASPVMAQCKDVSEAKDLAAKAGATSWVEMTHDQLEFARGIFALDPDTPTGLPPGVQA